MRNSRNTRFLPFFLPNYINLIFNEYMIIVAVIEI